MNASFWGLAIFFGGFYEEISPLKRLDFVKSYNTHWTNDNKKPAISNGFFTLLDSIGLFLGAWGRNRTDTLPGNEGF